MQTASRLFHTLAWGTLVDRLTFSAGKLSILKLDHYIQKVGNRAKITNVQLHSVILHSIAPLISLPNLTKLSLESFKTYPPLALLQKSFYQELGCLTTLKTLVLKPHYQPGLPLDSNQILHISPLTNITSLTIDVHEVVDISAFSAIAYPKLKFLDVGRLPWELQPKGTAGFERCTDLTSLTVHSTPIRDNTLSFLHKATNLRTLKFIECHITDNGFHPITHLVGMHPPSPTNLFLRLN